MNRMFLFAAATGVVAGLAGCSSSARFIERGTAGGVVAVPDYKHRDDGIALIEREVGKRSGQDYVITEEGEVSTGTVTKTVQAHGTGSIFVRMFSWLTGEKENTTNVTTTGSTTEWRIQYVRPNLPGSQPSGNVIQTQYLSPGSSPTPSINNAPGASTPPTPTTPAGFQSRLSVFEYGKDCKT